MFVSLQWRRVVRANLLALVVLALCGKLTPTMTPQPTAVIPTAEVPSPSGGIPELDPALPVVEGVGGLKYIDVAPGEGAEAKNGDVLAVMYTGYLEDGTMFDQSASPYPVTLGTGSVIQGWEEGLLGIKAGGKRRLIIPPALGYGANGGGPIPPNATLIFDVEIVSINAQ